MSDNNSESTGVSRWKARKGLPFGPEAGRTFDDNSVDASSEDPRGTDHGYIYSGYDTPAATRIGDERRADGAERLRELNEGRHQAVGDYSSRQAERDKKRISEAVCSDLPINTHEKEVVVGVIGQLDFEQFGNQKELAGVSLGTAAVVVDEYQRDGGTGETPDTILRFSDEYSSVRESLELSMSDLNTIKQTVREQLESGAVQLSKTVGVSQRDPALPEPTPLSERPDEYWDNKTAEDWEKIAKGWERIPRSDREAIPDRHRQLVERLRMWKPWEWND